MNINTSIQNVTFSSGEVLMAAAMLLNSQGYPLPPMLQPEATAKPSSSVWTTGRQSLSITHGSAKGTGWYADGDSKPVINSLKEFIDLISKPSVTALIAGHEVVIQRDGVKVGCQKVTWEQLQAIWNARPDATKPALFAGDYKVAIRPEGAYVCARTVPWETIKVLLDNKPQQ